MGQQIIFNFSEEELLAIFKQGMREVLKENSSNPGSELKELLNIDEASQFIMLAKQTIYGMTSNRQIPFLKRGKKLMFRRSELQQWLYNSKKQTNEELVNSSNSKTASSKTLKPLIRNKTNRRLGNGK